MEQINENELRTAELYIEENPKATLWIKFFLTPGSFTYFNAARSAEAAGYECSSPESFKSRGYEIKQKVLPVIRKWLDENGLSPENIVAKFIELVEAKEIKFFASKGMVWQEEEISALDIQLKANQDLAKIQGLYAPEKKEIVNKSHDDWMDDLDKEEDPLDL